MQGFPLSTEAELRILSLSDVEEMYTLIDAGREYLREYLPWVDSSRSSFDTRQFIQATILQHERNQGTHYGIWYRGKLAGTLGIHGVQWANRHASIGYWLGENFQGKGLMTTAVREYIHRLVFGLWNLNRVQISAATQNYKSRSIPERLGFQLEGVLRENEYINDHYVDHAVYGMLVSDWRKKYPRVF